MNKPELTPITTSSAFDGYHYDPNTRVLTVRYKGGRTYTHEDVPMEKVEAFAGNVSPGRYFNENIKGNHAAKKVE